MKVLVVGAAGKTGKLVVEKALAAGHTVTAFVHDAMKFEPPSADVRVIEGNATEPYRVADAVIGQDAIIDTIGGKTPFLSTTLEEDVARAILVAMRQHDVRRIIAVSALGAGDSKDQGTFFYDHVVLPTFLRGSTKDKEHMETLVMHADVEFVLVRPAVLTDDPATGNVKVVEGHDKAHKITRADVAQFIVDQLVSNAYVGKAVTVANS